MNKNFLINAMYAEILETYGAHTPFQTAENSEREHYFEKKYAPDYELSKTGTFTDTYTDFSEELTELIWGNIRNAFEVGFNRAIQFLIGGSTVSASALLNLNLA